MAQNFFDRIAPTYEAWMKRLKFIFIKDLFDRMAFRPGMKVLDLGGGPGIYSEAVSRKGCEVVLMDSSSQMIEMAAKKEMKAKLLVAEAHDIPFAVDYFDVILCMDALHHFKNREMALQEMARVLKPGGKLYIQEFDGRRLTTRILWVLERMVGERSYFYSPSELTDQLKALGIEGTAESFKAGQFIFLGTQAQ